jgi:aspartate-semialdehyde dehydrogenase
MVSHSEAVNIEFMQKVTARQVYDVLKDSEGIIVLDDPAANLYPMPVDAAGKDEVFAGRIRQDATLDTAVDLWIVADNLRKGAATNAVQIAELMVRNGLI